MDPRYGQETAPDQPEAHRRDRLGALRISTGAAFVVAGLPKFIAFGWELDAFRRFGLPLPYVWVVAAGLIEILEGALLLTGNHVRVAAALLTITMAVAVYSSGIRAGDIVPSLTLAPILLLASATLAVTGGRSRPDVAHRPA